MLMWILGLVLIFIGIGITVYFKVTEEQMNAKMATISTAFSVCGIVIWILGLSFIFVPTGYTGIRITCGQVSEDVVPSGLNFKIPFVQTIKLINNKQQDEKIKTQVWGETSEKTPVYASDVTVSYKIAADKASWLYTNVTNLDNLIFTDTVSSAIKSAMSELTYDKVTVRSIIEPKIKEYLEDSLIEKYGEDVIYIQKVIVSQMDFEDSYNQAIAAKSLALQTQEKQKIENETAIAKAEANKQVSITNAQAEAQAKIIRAEADAQANELLTQSLDDKILKSKLYEKWDGKLPAITGNANSIINATDFVN